MSTPPPIDLSVLPPDVRAVVEAQQAQIVMLTELNARLEHLVKEFQRALYGKSSEKLTPDERQLAFEDLETAVSEAEAAKPAADATPAASRSGGASVKRNLGRLPRELPRIEAVIEPASTLCPCGCGEMTAIGEDRTERLDARRGNRPPDGFLTLLAAGAVPRPRHDPPPIRVPALPDRDGAG